MLGEEAGKTRDPVPARGPLPVGNGLKIAGQPAGGDDEGFIVLRRLRLAVTEDQHFGGAVGGDGGEHGDDPGLAGLSLQEGIGPGRAHIDNADVAHADIDLGQGLGVLVMGAGVGVFGFAPMIASFGQGFILLGFRMRARYLFAR